MATKIIDERKKELTHTIQNLECLDYFDFKGNIFQKIPDVKVGAIIYNACGQDCGLLVIGKEYQVTKLNVDVIIRDGESGYKSPKIVGPFMTEEEEAQARKDLKDLQEIIGSLDRLDEESETES